MIDYPNKLDKIFDKLELFNIKSIIVGGYIRDSLIKNLLNQEKKDIDIEVYGVDSLDFLEELLQEFGSVNSVGKSFGICKLSFDDLDLDFSLPRLDSKISSGHKGFRVETAADIDFSVAAFRRDFTINSIGFDVKERKILDPYNGIRDLKNRTLNAVDKNTFLEDPLRVLRAVRFAARFDFKLGEDTFSLCQEMIQNRLLNELSKERVFDEIKKLLLKSDSPSIGFNLLKKLGALEFFPALKSLNEEDWNFTLLALDNMSRLKTRDNKTNIVLMLAITSYKFNKALTLTFISNLTSDKNILKRVLALTQNRLKTEMSNSEIYILAQYVNLEESIILHSALFKENVKLYDKIKAEAKNLGVLNGKLKPLLQGKELIKHGLTPSKEFSKIISLAYKAQMCEAFKNKIEALKWLDKMLSL